MTSWGAEGDPMKDMQRAKELMENETFEPVIPLGTRTQSIILEALDLFHKYKVQWRKDHRILAFLEKISNKIRGKS